MCSLVLPPEQRTEDGPSSMDLFLYAALALLALLACCDLFVGVSNDAVNFLNSAVGSRTAPFWVIRWEAIIC